MLPGVYKDELSRSMWRQLHGVVLGLDNVLSPVVCAT